MKKFSLKNLTKFQQEMGFFETQELINNGMAWKLEGSIGRYAMNLIDIGICILPTESFYDYYGNKIPSRNELKKGTKGTELYCKNLWENNKETANIF
jgi:hypothetical protein